MILLHLTAIDLLRVEAVNRQLNANIKESVVLQRLMGLLVDDKADFRFSLPEYPKAFSPLHTNFEMDANILFVNGEILKATHLPRPSPK